MVLIISARAALGYADKTAILLGNLGITNLFSGLNKPSLANCFFNCSYFKNKFPNPSCSIVSTYN